MAGHRNVREEAAGEGSRAMAGAVGGSLARRDTKQDAWEKLLVDAGLETLDARPLAVGGLTPTQAARLLGQLMQKPVTLGNFPPRMAAGFLLREVLEGGEVSREELLRRVERFSREQVAVLRPDGYLAWALNGNTQQKVAPVEWKDGAFRAHGFELGRFYSGKGGVFRQVDAQLQASDWRPLAEVYSDADVISRSLDGAQDAFVDLYHALGQALSRPVDSMKALSHLPAGIAALIASSPAYWERFRYMTRGEQIREVARLATSFIATWGAASATTRTLTGLSAGVEATVPVLSLSVEGALVVERVAVPVGRAASVLSGGPGAAIILHRTGAASGQPSAPEEQGPGRWGSASESMSEASRKYQAQVTGAPAGKVYTVHEVKFDGFKMGVLLETKGPGYARFLKDGSFRTWFRGADGMLEQAKRQFKAAKGTPIHWHFAEREVADAVRDLFRNEGLGTIKVVFTPPSP
ncbi:Tox-REase-5 domain-containing protein [Corallococcus sp. CA054B]|uniref:Tox-REase-5 domain-containing protein n=1 Tax=Corallococcus sp. CA054B TaxID=2316734 RepID=UPI001F3BE4C7|nr:Tox-REase-5 domain-containing protein [Corallococcus sp. CA054B]